MPETKYYVPLTGELAQIMQLREERLSRAEQMVKTWGECCNRVTAARILSRDRSTIYEMLRDGRLRTACEGKMVDVRSIAEYLERPQAMDSQARYAKRAARGEKTSKWRV